VIIKEKRHRLPKEFYIGKIPVAFTLSLKGDVQGVIKNEIISIFTDILTSAVIKRRLYCTRLLFYA
jgi:hypothetical protein